METTSKLWDLNYEAESLEKADFLYYQDAPKTISYKEKGEGNAKNQIYLKRERVIHQDRAYFSSALKLHYTPIQSN